MNTQSKNKFQTPEMVQHTYESTLTIKMAFQITESTMGFFLFLINNAGTCWPFDQNEH